MEREIVYMLGIVAVGFAVNYALRALPFLLFAGHDRELPKWVLRFGDFISPVIIAALIVYSYSGLAWKTAWPYLAGALTVGLQLWRKNALLSIVVGTVLYMFLVAGCVTDHEMKYGVDNPILELSSLGLKFDGKYVDPKEVPELLEEYQIPHSATIHIGITQDVMQQLGPVRTFQAYLAKNGYRRSVMVTDMHGESSVKQSVNGGSFRGTSAAPAKPRIRYKGGNE